MPELPEVETIARDLREEVLGARITGVEQGEHNLLRWPHPRELGRVLLGRGIETVGRRGKYLRLGLGDEVYLVVHLGMSGRLEVAAAGAPRRPHTHLVVHFEDSRELRYSDPRRFGRLGAGTPWELAPVGAWPELGPEPLEEGFDLYACLRGMGRPLKAALLDQQVVAGVGNIYADEALWRARLSPWRQASLKRAQAARLQVALQEVLEEAIGRRGSSIAQYRDGRGAKGQAQEHLAAYGRGGQPCLRCGRVLRSGRLQGRTTVWCARCQG